MQQCTSCRMWHSFVVHIGSTGAQRLSLPPYGGRRVSCRKLDSSRGVRLGECSLRGQMQEVRSDRSPPSTRHSAQCRRERPSHADGVQGVCQDSWREGNGSSNWITFGSGPSYRRAGLSRCTERNEAPRGFPSEPTSRHSSPAIPATQHGVADTAVTAPRANKYSDQG